YRTHREQHRVITECVEMYMLSISGEQLAALYIPGKRYNRRFLADLRRRLDEQFGDTYCMASDAAVGHAVLVFELISWIDHKLLDDFRNLDADCSEGFDLLRVVRTFERPKMVIENKKIESTRRSSLRVADGVAQAVVACLGQPATRPSNENL